MTCASDPGGKTGNGTYIYPNMRLSFQTYRPQKTKVELNKNPCLKQSWTYQYIYICMNESPIGSGYLAMEDYTHICSCVFVAMNMLHLIRDECHLTWVLNTSS